MNVKVFFTKLRKLAGQFKLNDDGEVRDLEGHCPICALAHKQDPGSCGYLDYRVGGHVLGLRYESSRRISIAADYPNCEYPGLRRKMLAALQLKEKD